MAEKPDEKESEQASRLDSYEARLAAVEKHVGLAREIEEGNERARQRAKRDEDMRRRRRH